MHLGLVTGGHFRSRDKDGSHTIRSTTAEDSTLHASFMVLRIIEAEYCRSKFYIAETGFWTFFLFPWPWLDLMHDRRIRTWPIFPGNVQEEQKQTSYVKASESYHLDRRTYIQTYGLTDMTKIIYHSASRMLNNLNINTNITTAHNLSVCHAVFDYEWLSWDARETEPTDQQLILWQKKQKKFQLGWNLLHH